MNDFTLASLAFLQGLFIGFALIGVYRGLRALRAHLRRVRELEERATRCDLLLWHLHATMVLPDQTATHAICVCGTCEQVRRSFEFMPGGQWRLRGVRLS